MFKPERSSNSSCRGPFQVSSYTAISKWLWPCTGELWTIISLLGIVPIGFSLNVKHDAVSNERFHHLWRRYTIHMINCFRRVGWSILKCSCAIFAASQRISPRENCWQSPIEINDLFTGRMSRENPRWPQKHLHEDGSAASDPRIGRCGVKTDAHDLDARLVLHAIFPRPVMMYTP